MKILIKKQNIIFMDKEYEKTFIYEDFIRGAFKDISIKAIFSNKINECVCTYKDISITPNFIEFLAPETILNGVSETINPLLNIHVISKKKMEVILDFRKKNMTI